MREPGAWEAVRPHLWLHGIVLAVVGGFSFVGEGWGYFVVYVVLLAALAISLLTVAAGLGVYRRLRRGAPSLGLILKRILRSFAIAELWMVVALLAVAVVARSSSGPIGKFPGGPLSGKPGTEPVDWSLAEGLEEIQIQLRPDRPYSITTHFFIVEGDLYVGADFVFPFKRWVHLVEQDDRVLVRVRDSLYPRRATRIRDPEEHRRILVEISRQKGVSPEDWLTELWFFRMDPR